MVGLGVAVDVGVVVPRKVGHRWFKNEWVRGSKQGGGGGVKA